VNLEFIIGRFIIPVVGGGKHLPRVLFFGEHLTRRRNYKVGRPGREEKN
jgi:hypothetical protein